ncbi:hypothetical protein Taro_028294 [Colocasia esculenta]|uniref:Uncharacterized protein n=1 Tax=Colocasia esculenta TaxID=4460 RepID=A0A843VI59_COLES|nr:hypothetical protein [Colocasia esculenta]
MIVYTPSWAKNAPNSILTKTPPMQEIPAFPSQGQVRAFSWLVNLINAITLDMRNFIGMWHLNFMVVLAKNMKDMWWGFDALGALIERWHPHIHTFVFQGFEASVLLEEGKGRMRSRVTWDLCWAWYRALPETQQAQIARMGFGHLLSVRPFHLDVPYLEALRERWEEDCKAFIMP